MAEDFENLIRISNIPLGYIYCAPVKINITSHFVVILFSGSIYVYIYIYIYNHNQNLPLEPFKISKILCSMHKKVEYNHNRGCSTPQSSSCTATHHLSRKLSKLDEPDMQDTAGKVETSSLVMYSYGSLHVAEQKLRRPVQTYLQQLCEDTGCSPEDLLKVMNDREGWRERVRDIHADGTR